MFAVQPPSIIAFLISTVFVRVHADVVPTEPGPGQSYNQGSTCRTTWTGDTTSKSPNAWKNMSIELMTSDNSNMVHLTSVWHKCLDKVCQLMNTWQQLQLVKMELSMGNSSFLVLRLVLSV
jgi:hypothetical protein